MTASAALHGRHPEGVSVTPDNKKVYVANKHDNTISIIDTTTNKVKIIDSGGLSPASFGQFIGNYSIGNKITPTKTTPNINNPSQIPIIKYLLRN